MSHTATAARLHPVTLAFSSPALEAAYLGSDGAPDLVPLAPLLPLAVLAIPSDVPLELHPAVPLPLSAFSAVLTIICARTQSVPTLLVYVPLLVLLYVLHAPLLLSASVSPYDAAALAALIAVFGRCHHLVAAALHLAVTLAYYYLAPEQAPVSVFVLGPLAYALAARSHEVARRRKFAQETTRSVANPAVLSSLLEFYGQKPTRFANANPQQVLLGIIRGILARPEFRSNALYELEYVNKVLSARAFDVSIPRGLPVLPDPLDEEETEAAFRLLDRSINMWSFDVFAIADATRGQPLYYVGLYLFRRFHFLKTFKIHPARLHHFLRQVEAGYATNPFHNSTHAADVTLNTVYMLSTGVIGSAEKPLTDLEKMALILAAIVHDYRHPGLSNSFEVHSESELAQLYNDRSVLENYHISSAFALLKDPLMDIREGLDREQRRKLRSLMVETVLATDMALHFDILDQFKRALGREDFDFGRDADRILTLRVLIKTADIAHTTKTSKLHIRWSECIQNEFFSQGDLERRLGLPISPAMDRRTVALAPSQVGFLQFVAGPLFDAWAKFCPDHEHMANQLRLNQKEWSKRQTP